jgi:NAD(P) transhydrogenase subunit alpha
MSELLQLSKDAIDLSDRATILASELRALAIEQVNAAACGSDQFIFAFTIFILSCFVGYYVVWKVTPALHTPLMSVTNAISGIIIIGSLLAMNSDEFSFSTFVGFVATMIASINIFGGFVVTHRMLSMFKKK